MTRGLSKDLGALSWTMANALLWCFMTFGFQLVWLGLFWTRVTPVTRKWSLHTDVGHFRYPVSSPIPKTVLEFSMFWYVISSPVHIKQETPRNHGKSSGNLTSLGIYNCEKGFKKPMTHPHGLDSRWNLIDIAWTTKVAARAPESDLPVWPSETAACVC